MVEIKFAKIKADNGARIPSKRDEDAGYDMYACFEEDAVEILPNETKLIPTGLAACVPVGYYLQVEERGSTGSIGMKKSAGVIDSGYRNEIFIAITNCNRRPIVITKNENAVKTEDTKVSSQPLVYPYKKAIAQLVLHEVIPSEVEEISYEELKAIPSERGLGKLGSSGK